MDGKLEVMNLSVGYDVVDVIENVSLVADPGKNNLPLGCNGAGKTTIIRALLSLTAPRAGKIDFCGNDITGLSTHSIVARGIGCIPEGRKVFPKLTVEENLRMGAYRERSRGIIERRIDECYDIFPRLKERREQLAGTLSGGEQAMVSIGRGLMSAPKMLLVDEPSLDCRPGSLLKHCE